MAVEGPKKNLKAFVSNIPVGKQAGASYDSSQSDLMNKKLFILNSVAKFCDKCGTPYNPDDVQIVSEDGLNTIIHFSCNKCKANHMANFVAPMGIATRIPINSDLSPQEVVRFANEERVTEEIALKMYDYLCENFNNRKIKIAK